MIPIKGYATFDPLKHCIVGSSFKTEWFRDLDIYKNDRIMDPLKRIAEETEEDYQTLEKILIDAGVKTYRPRLDITKVKSLKNISEPLACPRDYFATVGETFYAISNVMSQELKHIIRDIDKKNLYFGKQYVDKQYYEPVSTAQICRVGKDIWWDIPKDLPSEMSDTLIDRWKLEGFRVHTSNRYYHTDSCFCVVKPGCIVSLYDVQDYAKEFPGWDVLYLPEQSWSKVDPFLQMKDKVGGRWWLKGEEHNDQLIEFVNTWLKDWVGYVEETVFDVNMLSIDQNTIICNNYNKDVFAHFKRHKVEPIIFNFRHRYFWDGGVHCITQDLYREGTQEDYFG
jgi:hypothetical protein|tara:strand:- start:322 stop:1338 length:1017 start_codon:yes stop_codon:yes gene_type:complete